MSRNERLPLAARMALAIGALAVVIAIALLRPSGDGDPDLHAVAMNASPAVVALDESARRAVVLSSRPGPNGFLAYTIDIDAGTLLRTTLIGSGPLAAVADPHTARVFVACADGTVRVLDARTGAPVRTVAVPVATAPGTVLALATGADRVFVAGNKSLSVLDAWTGRVVRTASLPIYPQGMAVSAATSRIFISGYGDNTPTGDVRIFDVVSGRRRGIIVMPGSSSPGSMAVDERAARVVVLDRGSGVLGVLDARNGRVLRMARLGMAPGIAVAMAPSGRVFAAVPGNGSTGRVAVVEVASGRRLSTVAVGQDTLALVADGRRGRVLAVDGGGVAPGDSGTIRVLDGTTGRVIHTWRLAQRPQAVAVGETSERIVVVGNAVGAVATSDPWGWMPTPLRRRLPMIPSVPHPQNMPGRVDVLDMGRL